MSPRSGRSRGARAELGAAASSVWAASLYLSVACSSSLSSGGQAEGEPGPGGSAVAAPGGPPPPIRAGLGGLGGQVVPTARGRLARLTHAQWENSVRDLLLLSRQSGLSATFPSDALASGFVFDNSAESLQVDQALWGAYGRAASVLAQELVADEQRLERLAPPSSGGQEARAEAFVVSFGERVYRRPLSNAEANRYQQLYRQGEQLYEDTSGFAAGVRLVVEAMLQSPNFLYRRELSDEVVAGSIPLSAFEVAERLSFLLTNTTPDDALLQAARSGALGSLDGVREQAARLAGSPLARPALLHFHEQLFEVDRYTGINPSARAFPGISEELAGAAVESSRLFLQELAFSSRGTFADLMTSSEGFVNAELASVYEVAGSYGERFEKVQLPPQRRGFLSQVGFLATNATSVQPDPIHRGVFISERVLCRTIAAPPDGVPPLPPVVGATNRETVENHTESTPRCAACHKTLINPLGFAFEQFDAVGAFRTTDNGFPVDTSVSMTLDGEARSFAGSTDLLEALASSEEAHGCFARHLFEYAFGREASSDDAPLIDELTAASLEGATIPSLLLAIAQSGAFLTRSTQELP